MNSDLELVRRHVAALRQEAQEAKVPLDVLGRMLVQEAIGMWTQERDWRDIARELAFVAESLDPDTDHEFMRP